MKIDKQIRQWAQIVNESNEDEKFSDIYDDSLTYDKLKSKYEDVPPNGLWDDDSKYREDKLNTRIGKIWNGAIKFACSWGGFWNGDEPKDITLYDKIPIYINGERFEVLGNCFASGDRLFALLDNDDTLSEVIYKDGKYKFIAVEETLQDLCKDVSDIYVYCWDTKNHTYETTFKQED